MSQFAKAILKAMEEMTLPRINYSTFIPASMPPEIIEIYLTKNETEREAMYHDWLKFLSEN